MEAIFAENEKQKMGHKWTEVAFWNELAGDPAEEHIKSMPAPGPSTSSSKTIAAAVMDSGFCKLPRPADARALPKLLARLQKNIGILKSRGLPAQFALLYPEAFQLMQFYPLPPSLTAKNISPTFDILAFSVDPREGECGFSPHRDRQPEDVGESFTKEGVPKYLTQWVAVTDANPDNSCLYVIPAQHDPGYHGTDDDCNDGGGEDVDPGVLPLHRALSRKETFQHVRALPTEPGGSILFSHRIIHWGSTGDKNTCVEPRMALSFT